MLVHLQNNGISDKRIKTLQVCEHNTKSVLQSAKAVAFEHKKFEDKM